MSGTKTHYDVLKIKASASAAEVEDAYRRRIARLHTKIAEGNLPPRADFDALEDAYAILRDPEARADYDARLSRASVRLAVQPSAEPPPRSSAKTANPYAPPIAVVADQDALAPDEERLIPGGRSQPAGNGWLWLSQGWQLFKAQPLNWWLSILVGFGLFIAMSIIPFVNMLTILITYPLIAGYGACARSVLYEGRFEINQMFDGFRYRFGALVCLGLLYLVILIGVMGIIVALMGGAGMLAMLSGVKGGAVPPVAAIQAMGVLFIAYFLVSILVASLFIYAPYMIHEHDAGVFAAMGYSIQGCLRNIPAFLVYMVVTFIAMVLATLPIGLGWLIMLPVLYLSIYASYRDIFVEVGEAN